ncbi:MAG: exodeoxyribonuclease alpha subunit [Candidatus Dependentiae bacterium]|nr:exodeoxyribonuclease alpha subunit [Candidatus Dependentiae bacterium]
MTGTVELVGTVQKCLFKNNENGYMVFLLAVNAKETVTVTGCFPDVHEGTRVSLEGTWQFNPKFGKQFAATKCSVQLPQTANGIEKYLASGLIKGVGPVFARKLVSHFGERTLDIIDTAPHRLSEVSGVGPKRIEQIVAAWQEQKEVSRVMVFLQEKGVGTGLASKIYKAYGATSIETISKNPYKLIEDVWGVGFKSADTLALKLGFVPNSMPRIQAGVVFSISTALDEGNLYKVVADVLTHAAELLELSYEQNEVLIKQAMRALYEANKIRVVTFEGQHYATLPQYYYAEVGIAKKLRAFSSNMSQKFSFDIDAAYKTVSAVPLVGVQLNDEQQLGVIGCLKHKVSIITGGPGTGKTTLLKSLLQVLDQQHVTVKLAAPTGRAAKRMFEGTGRSTETLHRMLEFSPATMGFTRNEQNAIQADFVVVDEASMIDVFLMHSLLKALPDRAHLVLLGDVDQLPSVGAGNILHDLINSGVVNITRLKHIFRQAQDSLIIVNAHRVNNGEFPSSKGIWETSKKDFMYIKQEAPEELFDFLRKFFATTIKQYHCVWQQAVILTPMNRGIAGTQRINQELQMILNSEGAKGPTVTRFGQEFRVNDRVMQVRNNYDKFVFNGDIGFITAINVEDQEITITFGERALVYQYLELGEIVLAYAISVHKSQGSEFDVVVIPLFVQHFMLLQRNLIYTAITRAKKLCVLVGQTRAIAMGVRNVKGNQRLTFLQQFLTGALPL